MSVVWETNRLTREGVGDTVLVGSWEPPQAAAKSLLRARLFREVLSDLIQLGCALSVKLHCGVKSQRAVARAAPLCPKACGPDISQGDLTVLRTLPTTSFRVSLQLCSRKHRQIDDL